MATQFDSILSRMNTDKKEKPVKNKIKYDISHLIQKEQYVGEVVQLVYSEAKIQINDSFRKKVGGIPGQCFLIASRINPDDKNIDFDEEDSCAILLRVIDSANLPGDMDKERILSENAQKVQGTAEHWDRQLQDAMTKNMMSYGALKCRVIGTFYMQENQKEMELSFGNDLSNFYPNRGLKVYKPSEQALEAIVNFGIDDRQAVNVGQVRYSSTNRVNSKNKKVFVKINPKDLIAQKTAVFGMTRTGKSNTVKIIAKTLYQLRQKTHQRIGQLIFDANGEYANENLQDKNDLTGQAEALRNIWKVPVDGVMGSDDDVVTYGLLKNDSDPNRVVMKINFYDEILLQTGKELIDDKLLADPINNVQYVKSFISTGFESLIDMPYNEQTREKRRRLIYKTILFKSGFKAPQIKGTLANSVSKESGLFSEKLIKALEEGIKDYAILNENKQRECSKRKSEYADCAEIFTRFNTSGSNYAELARAFKSLSLFIEDPESTYHDFERNYTSSSDGAGTTWLDVYLSSLLKMFQYDNAFKKIGRAGVYHDPASSKKDYAQMIYEDLANGKLVIVDQALGDPDLNQLAAERILRKIFEENNKQFSQALAPSNIIIYIEEAHNLMPKGSEEDTTNIWARVAKEGAKFNIGMIYSTQEVSSIQKNILKNTTNWFISHLNNKEEIRALSDFYDFEDFSQSILQAEDKGFIRMKTRSNRFVVPIQVDKFQISD